MDFLVLRLLAQFNYLSLLLNRSRSDDPEVLEWLTHSSGNQDWVQEEHIQRAIDPSPIDLGAFLYEDDEAMKPFR